MSDLDALAESARNRGLKLVRSRVRTPGKRRFGKAGLTDTKGKPVFGMDSKGPTAKPEEVVDYLRGLGADDWAASLNKADLQKAKSKAKAAPRAKAEPKIAIRDARPADAPTLVKLIQELGHPIDEKAVRKNLALLAKVQEQPLVAAVGREVVGLCGVHSMIAVHRDAPVGRINILVVTKAARGRGIGKMLVDAAEARLRKRGCEIVEVTSNDKRANAHAFYQHLGYERTSARFVKTL